MARWKRSESAETLPGIRQAFRDRNAPLWERYGSFADGSDWARVVRAVDSGRPFVVKGWQFPAGFKDGIQRDLHYEVDAAGGVSELSEAELRG